MSTGFPDPTGYIATLTAEEKIDLIKNTISLPLGRAVLFELVAIAVAQGD